jgi:DNA polymerase
MERQVGKVSELALGYQGGINAYYTMCAPYGLSLAPVFPIVWGSATVKEKESAHFAYEHYRKSLSAEASESGRFFDEKQGLCADIIKQRWRIQNNKISKYWYAIEASAVEAMEHATGNRVYHCPVLHVSWSRSADFLYLILPSGRKLAYFKPEIQETQTRYGKSRQVLTCLTIDSKTKQFIRRAMYGGLWTENIVQAASRDIMVSAMFAVENAGYPIVLTVHDELLLDVPAETEGDEIKHLMIRPINWAKGLPLMIGKPWKAERYQK